MSNGNKVWGRRLKEIRTEMELSQKQLGIQAGLDPFVASTRINRYELGVHKADYKIAQRLAEILRIPAAYFYTEDDHLAEIMLIYHRANQKKKNELLKAARKLTEVG
ncbi:helix-turn-helix transcriptional regulator [Noviherbaspirillum sp.]|uniref:helix-turn-helix domain-containing protein n=1 Tax=Noviherbaspirillum sp. TaxID=1926288 RepID=UPI0025FBDF3C|nr:helix-turn-helix transcriptional regulator [Noviherbaspirillum sp.]